MDKVRRVIVVNPPNPPGYISNKDSMGGFGHLFPVGATNMPPLDLVYLASYLVENGVDVEVLECLGLELSQQEFVQRVQAIESDRHGSDVPTLLVCRTSAPTLDWDLESLAAAKQRNPFLRIAIYGAIVPHVVDRIVKEACVDYIISGEPDETILELVNGEAESGIAGLTYRQNGSWSSNIEQRFNTKLDTLPFPKWELFPHENYKLPRSSARPDMKFLPMLSSRGCPVGCHYCPYPVGQGLQFRLRSPENVVDEIEHLVNDLGVKYILFRDPIFSLNQKRVLEICHEIVRRDLKFEWRCETRVDCLREDTLKAMAEAGCNGINFGVESAEVEIQKNVGRKPITQERFMKMIDLCHELGIKTFGFFIIGLPGDTLDTIMDTLKFAINMNANWIQFTSASPFIGTQLRQWALENGYATEDEYAYVNSFSVTMGNENLSKEEVRALARYAQFIANYLVNRKGILKDETRPGRLYRAGKGAADAASKTAANTAYSLGRWYFQRRINTT